MNFLLVCGLCVFCRRAHVLLYVIIMCVCLGTVVSNTYCVVFLFCFSSSCVPNVAIFSGLGIFDCPSVFHMVFGKWEGNVQIKLSLNLRKINFKLSIVGKHFAPIHIYIFCMGGRRGRGRLVVGFSTPCAIKCLSPLML